MTALLASLTLSGIDTPHAVVAGALLGFAGVVAGYHAPSLLPARRRTRRDR